MKPVSATLLALLIAPMATLAQAEVTFTPFAAYHWFDSNTLESATQSPVSDDIEDDLGFALALGYRFTPAIGVELNYGRTESEPDMPPAVDIRTSRLTLDGYYTFNADGKVSPYVLAGAGQGRLKLPGLESVDDTIINGGIGMFWRFNDSVALRAEARNVYNRDEHLNDQLALIGVEFSAGGSGQTEASAPAPEPAQQPVEQLAAAPAAIVAAVVDSDGDGVPDTQDSCAATPAGVQVDASGCPLDGDKDGVADYQDKCPDSVAGAAVDASGCYEKLARAVSIAIDVKFATGKADIQGDATAEIQKIADFMQKYPQVNVTIEGHTDNRGNAANNKQLSQKRADAVKAEVVKLGVDAGRLSAVGYGADKPIADNNTEEGRAQNRRVVASAQAQTETIRMKK